MLDEILTKENITGFPDKELEKLIKKWNTTQLEEDFIKVADRLDQTRLLSPLAMNNDEISGFVLIENKNTHKYYMIAFTSVNEYKKWEKTTNYKKLSFMVESLANIASIVIKPQDIEIDGLVIDPYGMALTMPKEIIQEKNQELNPVEKRQINSDEIEFGNPKNMPIEMLKKISKFFDDKGYIEKAYIQMLKQGNALSYLLLLDIPSKKCEELYSEIIKIAMPYSNLPLDMVRIEDSEFAKNIVKDIDAFYVKDNMI